MRKKTDCRRNLAIATLVAGLCAGCGQREAPAHEPTPVRVGLVGTLEESGGLRYSANIDALTQVNLAFKSGGYVDWIAQRKGADGRTRILQTGDRVSPGEIIARVRDSEYADKANSAKAQVDQAQANYDKAKLDFERATNLYKSDSYTKAQYDQAKATFDSGAASVEGAKANWQQAKTALADCSLHSPLAGWVLSRDVEVGGLVGNGTAAFVLADTHLVKAVFGVPDTRVGSVKLGAPQTILTTSLPNEFHGRVTSVSPSADPKSRVFSVEVTIPNSDSRLKPGMIATLTLGTGRLEQPTTIVPLSAVVRSSQHADGFAVFILTKQGEKSIVSERSVEIGDTLGNSIGITKGLKPGQSIVITGSTLVKDGDQVKVIP
jgi:membrane fusion protein, multidrug efflux system